MAAAKKKRRCIVCHCHQLKRFHCGKKKRESVLCEPGGSDTVLKIIKMMKDVCNDQPTDRPTKRMKQAAKSIKCI